LLSFFLGATSTAASSFSPLAGASRFVAAVGRATTLRHLDVSPWPHLLRWATQPRGSPSRRSPSPVRSRSSPRSVAVQSCHSAGPGPLHRSLPLLRHHEHAAVPCPSVRLHRLCSGLASFFSCAGASAPSSLIAGAAPDPLLSGEDLFIPLQLRPGLLPHALACLPRLQLRREEAKFLSF
jgi:hypothetical protein